MQTVTIKNVALAAAFAVILGTTAVQAGNIPAVVKTTAPSADTQDTQAQVADDVQKETAAPAKKKKKKKANHAELQYAKPLTTQASATVPAAPAAKTCEQVIKSIKSEWKVVDFSTPSKPTAVRVAGKYGHENTASQVAYMRDQIKQADADCKSGNQQASLQRVSSVRDLLDPRGISQETANAAMKEQEQEQE